LLPGANTGERVDALRHASPVRHAREPALDRLEPMLARLRTMTALREKKRGTFYRGSKAFIHFHEDGDDLFADVRFHDDFERFDVTTRARQRELATRIRAALQSP
jgi:hypothetical protein